MPATPEIAYAHSKYSAPPDSADLQPLFRTEMKNKIASLASLVKAAMVTGREATEALEEIAVYKFMVAQLEPLDKQIAAVNIHIEKKVARAAEIQKKVGDLQQEADTVEHDLPSLRQTEAQFYQEKESEADGGMAGAPIGARPVVIGAPPPGVQIAKRLPPTRPRTHG